MTKGVLKHDKFFNPEDFFEMIELHTMVTQRL